MEKLNSGLVHAKEGQEHRRVITIKHIRQHHWMGGLILPERGRGTCMGSFYIRISEHIQPRSVHAMGADCHLCSLLVCAVAGMSQVLNKCVLTEQERAGSALEKETKERNSEALTVGRPEQGCPAMEHLECQAKAFNLRLGGG